MSLESLLLNLLIRGFQVPNGPAKLEVLTSTMETKLVEAGSRFSARHALDIQREISRCKAEIDAAQRELLNVKIEVGPVFILCSSGFDLVKLSCISERERSWRS